MRRISNQMVFVLADLRAAPFPRLRNDLSFISYHASGFFLRELDLRAAGQRSLLAAPNTTRSIRQVSGTHAPAFSPLGGLSMNGFSFFSNLNFFAFTGTAN